MPNTSLPPGGGPGARVDLSGLLDGRLHLSWYGANNGANNGAKALSVI